LHFDCGVVDPVTLYMAVVSVRFETSMPTYQDVHALYWRHVELAPHCTGSQQDHEYTHGPSQVSGGDSNEVSSQAGLIQVGVVNACSSPPDSDSSSDGSMEVQAARSKRVASRVRMASREPMAREVPRRACHEINDLHDRRGSVRHRDQTVCLGYDADAVCLMPNASPR
jgi:hypothetical protein